MFEEKCLLKGKHFRTNNRYL